ncbi:hypothetical protein OTB20_08635 [Streptomyces sp. H27-H1]|uniref:hypothetical protein n=1 Tax=Streptomyces sp. H27-H1 TaxID=2996461 RepID=UPI002271805C|nr:hypothetical protein [Streptomyces sp. H27-H1]MCY0926272.1 hypothetical protein [Streptomyces sp. H27-H1]
MKFPIFKSRDADNIRVYVEEVHPGAWTFTRKEGAEVTQTLELSGIDAEREMTAYRNAEAVSFFRYYAGGSTA